jgi:hypothetical protein
MARAKKTESPPPETYAQIGVRLTKNIAEKYDALLGAIDEAKREVERIAAEVTGGQLVDKPAAAKYLNMCVTTLERRMAEPNGPPRHKGKGRVQFLYSELRAWRRQWRAGDQTGQEAQRA